MRQNLECNKFLLFSCAVLVGKLAQVVSDKVSANDSINSFERRKTRNGGNSKICAVIVSRYSSDAIRTHLCFL